MTPVSSRWPWLLAALLVPTAAAGQEPSAAEHPHEPDVSVQDDQPAPRALPRERARARTERARSAEEACLREDVLEPAAGALRETSGEIVRTKRVGIRGTRQENLVVMLDTSRGNDRLVVDLGPVDALRELRLGEGDHVAVEGHVHRVGDRRILVATRVREGDRTLRVDRSAQARHFASVQRTGAPPGTPTDQLALQERELEARSTPGLFQDSEPEMQDDDDFSDAQASVDIDLREGRMD